MKAWIEKLVVEGFKSYGKERLEIPLGEGFIAIVGPNGAGKSNIGDAISFALGLATAKTLRAKNLTYLIYSKGEEKAEYAYVEVHFKNQGIFTIEDEEVVISRKVYADGRSVYKINSQTVREKDVSDFLAKAGIFESAYNVVLQGDIIRFLRMTPLERRKLIEDISGVGEFEEKKQKALENLGEVELKIRELSLLIDEVEVQIERLSEELKRLQRYKEIKNQKKNLEIKLYLKELISIESQFSNLQTNEDSVRTQVESLKKDIANWEAKLKDLENELASLNDKLLPYRERVGKISSDLEHASQKLQELHKKKLRLQEDIIRAQEKVKEYNQILEKVIQEEEVIAKELEDKERELLKHEDEYSSITQSLLEREEGLKVSLEEAEKTEEKLKLLREELESKKKSLNDGDIRIREIDIKNVKIQEDIIQLEQELKAIKEQLGDASLKMENYNKLMKEEEIAIRKKKAELEETEGKLKNLRKEKEELLKEVAILESKLRTSESHTLPFQELRGVHGKVADLIKVKDMEYLKAIEAAGGGRLSYVVVDDEDVAKQCIQILKELKIGRMNFIPINRIKDLNLPPYPRQKGAIDFAVNLVEYDKRFEKAVRFVFGDTLVVEDFESAKRIGIGAYRMVTLEGELFEKTGVISGGYTESKGELGREFYAKELERLLSILEGISREEKVKEEALKSLREDLLEKESALRIIQRKIKELQERDEKSFARIKEIQEKINKAKDYLHIINGEKSQILSQREALTQEIEYLKEKIENLSLKRQSIMKHYVESGIEDLRQKQEKVRKLIDLKKEEILKLSLQLKDKEKDRENLQREINTTQEFISRAHQEIQDTEHKIFYLEEDRKDKEQELMNLESKAYELYRQKDTIESQIREAQSNLGRLKLLEEEKRDALSKLQNEKVRLEERIRDLREKLESIGWDGEVQEVKESTTKLKDEINRLTQEEKLYENVNLRAQEDYEEHKSRYEDLKQKHKKMLDEKKAIRELIQEIETKKTKAFMTAYESINKNLKRIFSYLSPGGKAYMVLEREDDPFAGGVNLVVKPRGKDVQYLEAISGGEKTLAALSLIFAIQDYQPSVFYYFDEVDAHLDEANSRKVGELIKDRSKNAQFIVVTLRESMAEYAQKLIGVSARNGISRVFPITNSSVLVGNQVHGQ